jgi:hypothetical protein
VTIARLPARSTPAMTSFAVEVAPNGISSDITILGTDTRVHALSTSRTAWAKSFGASCGRLCPTPRPTRRCSYRPENLFR